MSRSTKLNISDAESVLAMVQKISIVVDIHTIVGCHLSEEKAFQAPHKSDIV